MLEKLTAADSTSPKGPTIIMDNEKTYIADPRIKTSKLELLLKQRPELTDLLLQVLSENEREIEDSRNEIN